MSLSIRSLILIIIIGFALNDTPAQVSVQGDQQQTGSITGRVTIDGRGAPDFVVSLMPVISIGSARQKVIQAKTDGAGYFRLMSVPATDWRVMLGEPAQERNYVFSNRRELLEWGLPVTVPPGGVAEGIDFALTRGAVITGKALDERGQPVIGGWVTCLWFESHLASQPKLRNVLKSSGYEFGWRIKSEPVKTDGRGGYRFSGLPTGIYRVVFDHDDKDKYARTFHPNVTDETKAPAIEIRAGTEMANIDVHLSPRPRYAVTGRIIDAQTGKPLSNLPYGYHQIVDAGYEGHKSNDFRGDSGAQGEVQITHLLPGKYMAYVAMSEITRDLYCDPAVFEIRDTEVADVEIKVHRGASISGRAVIEGTNDPAVLARLAYLRLSILHFAPLPPISNYSLPSAKIVEDGRFRLSGMRPGKVGIRLEDFPKGLTLWSVERNGIEQRDWVFDLAPGEQLTGVRVVIAHSAGAIRGQIKVEGEESFIGKWMLFLSGVRGAPTLFFTDAVDEQGRFALDGLAPGTYTVSASRFGKSEGSSPFEDGTHGGQTVTVSNDKETPALIIVKKRER